MKYLLALLSVVASAQTMVPLEQANHIVWSMRDFGPYLDPSQVKVPKVAITTARGTNRAWIVTVSGDQHCSLVQKHLTETLLIELIWYQGKLTVFSGYYGGDAPALYKTTASTLAISGDCVAGDHYQQRDSDDPNDTNIPFEMIPPVLPLQGWAWFATVNMTGYESPMHGLAIDFVPLSYSVGLCGLLDVSGSHGTGPATKRTYPKPCSQPL